MPDPDWFEDLPWNRCLAEFSMWSADLCNLEAEVRRIEPLADLLHLDVADGVFAPSFLFFPDLVARMRALTALPLHVHLMVDDAVLLAQIDQFAGAGADLISVHAENAQAREGLARIRDLGILAGVVLKVGTDLEAARPLLAEVRLVTLLGTAIGVKGQGLNQAATGRIGRMREMVAGSGGRAIVAADGGIREATVPALVAAGAQTVVLGSLAFGSDDLRARIDWLRALPGGTG